MKRVFSINTELSKVTGVQRVLMDIHNALKDEYECKVVGTKRYEQVNPDVGVNKEDYIRLRNPFMFWKSIVVIHERKLLPLFWLLNHLFFQRIKLVYVHHNILGGLSWLPIPNHVVAISDRCGQNMKEVYRVKDSQIVKIHNCVKDIHPPIPHKNLNSKNIRLLLPARINSQKRQLEIVEHLRGKISEHVKILFAGVGPHYEELKKVIGKDNNFESIGYCDNVTSLMQEVDFMLLFSVHEGLPISLIEATMCGLPIICNDVGGNLEIAQDGRNAFVANDWNELIGTINNLPELAEKDYEKMSYESRHIYESYFNFEIFRKRYKELVRSL